MTDALYHDDAYCKDCQATITDAGEEGIVLDRTVFYPMGGGQPGDTGRLVLGKRSVEVTDTRYGSDGDIVHHVEPGHGLSVGDTVRAEIDWDRRYRHMRMHTALHLLGVALPHGVTGGNISAEKSRLDFDMVEPVDKEAVQERLDELVADDLAVRCRWITREELDEQPELVRTMSVQPPRVADRVRLLEIDGVDLQPCGGTHLRRTGEVGRVQVGKVEKKGRHNRRVNITLGD